MYCMHLDLILLLHCISYQRFNCCIFGNRLGKMVEAFSLILTSPEQCDSERSVSVSFATELR